jgi:Stress up-regulated Nod 19
MIISPPYNVTQAGYIYNVHAHLHDGGVNVRLFKDGALVCDSKAIYGGPKGTTSVDGQTWETIQGYEFCTKPIEINIGDQLTVESNYDLSRHRLCVENSCYEYS